MQPNIQLTEKNTKSRKGLYIQITYTNKKGKKIRPTRLYKYRGQETIDIYHKYYQDKYIHKKPRGTLQNYLKHYLQNYKPQKGQTYTGLTKSIHQYKTQQKKREHNIQTTITKGITTTTTPDAHTTTPQKIQQTLTKLYAPLVKDKDLLHLLTTQTNQQKIKHRLEHRITITNQKNETIATLTKTNKTLQEVINDIQQNTKKNTKLEYGFKALKNLGYTIQHQQQNETIKKISIQTIFRKAN